MKSNLKEFKPKLTLVNNIKFSEENKERSLKKKNLEVKGLGSVSTPEYRYSDVCPNAMK